MLKILLLAASAALAAAPRAGPAALAGLEEGRQVAGFTARALYLNADDQPMGARFVHPDGMPVDVLFFASVPQISVYAKTLPVSEKGEPHAGEHLLIGKGLIGKYLNSLISMRLAQHTAGTFTDLTNYQFHTSAGPEGFYDLLENYLKALLHPEFTDEEIRREAANLEVVHGGDGKLRLEEKGTVYNEMVSTMEKPDAINWDQLGRMVFGASHPLARNQGGAPAAIRELTPEDVRRFHDANYRLGPNMELVAALPLSWSAEDFLLRLGGIFERLEPTASTATYAALPPYQPLEKPEIRIGAFPSDDPNVPQSALFAWKPLSGLSREEALRVNLLLELLAGGETSYLYKDLVDQKTRKFDSGATGVSSYMDSPPLAYPLLTIDGLPAASVTPENLEKLRGAILERAKWLSVLAPGSGDLEEAAGKARSLISSERRSMLKFMDDPPHFGDRGTGIAWHRHLDHLDAGTGFRKSIPMKDAYDRLLKEVDSGLNPWTSIAGLAGILETPYVSAVRPDAALLKREKEEKAARLAEDEKKLAARFAASDVQAALAGFDAELAGKTKQLEARDRSIPKPKFLKDPPLTLDDADFTQTAWPKTRGLVKTCFGTTPFTDIHLLFDLTKVPAANLDLLPILSSALADLGARTRQGEALDYVKAQERVRSEIYGLSAGYDENPASKRSELSLTASAASPAEIDKAVEWLENYLLRRSTGAESRERLIDLVRRRIQGYRNVFQQPEEYWVQNAAAAYVYQNQPAYMAVHSPFTALRHLSRLRWRLEDPSPEARAVLEKLLSDAESAILKETRAEVGVRLSSATGELAEYLGFELSHLPPDSWREDMRRVIMETRADLAVPSASTLERLDAALRGVLTRSHARVALTGNPRDAARAQELLAPLLERLPETAAAEGAADPKPLVLLRLKERLPALRGSGVPVHVALVNEGTKTGVHVVSANGPSYRSRKPEDALDALAVGIFSGAAPQSFFMQTWSAGLAYSNGIRHNPATGKVRYYAERCPDLVQTMRFVAGLAAKTPLDDPFLVEYGLANAFSDYRAGENFSSRGLAMADDLADGNAPGTVKVFKHLLIETARSPGTLAAVRDRVAQAVGKVVVGLGPKVSSAPGAAAFVIGPEDLLARYEAYLKEQGETDSLVRLYPRDFWPDDINH